MESEDNEDLFFKFQNMAELKTCSPDHLQQTTHFSDLPFELVLYIFQLATDDDIVDVKTLNRCSAVCRGWYLCANDPILYKRTCSKLWTENNVLEYGGNWRRMLLKRSDLYTSGCYIYFDSMNRFFYYIRFISNGRFFSYGRFLLLKSKVSPKEMLPLIKIIEKRPLKNNVQTGRYIFYSNALAMHFDTPQTNMFDSCVFDNLYFHTMEYKCKRYGMLCCDQQDPRYSIRRPYFQGCIFQRFSSEF